jgi:demethyllactenocin mycarosyltransferase
VTLGTFQSYRSLNFFHIVMDAFRQEPYQVVMSVGQAADLAEFKDAPANFKIERFVPHARILPRASAVVHHGGFGIAQDTIYHGLPSVVVPVGQDLYENARRRTEAGVALRIPYSKLHSQRLREAMLTILHDEQIKKETKHLQKKFLKMNAGKTGADLLEKFADSQRPVYRPAN